VVLLASWKIGRKEALVLTVFEKSWISPGPVGLFRYLTPAKPAPGKNGGPKMLASKVQLDSPAKSS